jgi:hypothetical protein
MELLFVPSGFPHSALSQSPEQNTVAATPMSVQLHEIIPWGRSLDEYQRMFALTESDLAGRILGCGDGPASFNAELTQLGHRVISCDPIYTFSPAQILERFEASIDPVMSQVRAHPQNYVWTYHRSPEELLNTRKRVIRTFLSDYETGLARRRYVVAELPTLPFTTQSFDLAVSSHLLFLYSRLLSKEFHFQSILELCRVAKEVRLFPITTLECEISPHLIPLMTQLQHHGLKVELIKVDYQLQRNGNQMLRVSN